MIDLAILGLLKEQDLHGYELRKRVADLLGPGRSALSFGSLYPALTRLERTGLVKAVEASTRVAPAAPSSGSLAGELAALRSRPARPSRAGRGGRSRKVYGLTDEGAAHLVGLLTDSHDGDDRTFTVRVALCRFLAPPQRLALFQRRRDELATRLANHGCRAGTREPSRRDRYLRALREHDTETTSNEIAWLDRLIAEEQAEPTEDLHR